MGGIEIQYLLGLYFTITALSYVSGRLSADTVRLVAGVLLLIMAILGFSFIR